MRTDNRSKSNGDSESESREGAAPKKKRGMQKRGIERRRKFISAAREIMRTRSLQEMAFKDICALADVPPSSAYHFFANKFAIIEAIVEEVSPEFYQAIGDEIPAKDVETWRDVIIILFDRSIQYVNGDRSAREVLLGGHVPAEIRLATRIRDRKLGRYFRDAIGQFFVLPEIPEEEEVFFIFVQVMDTVVSLSQIEHGYVTDFMKSEAARLGMAYLSLYLPPTLPRRATKS